MNTTEHLQMIKSECERLIALSEKRTQGEWVTDHLWVDTEHANDYIKATGNVFNAPYIASCAGRAEAGWRSTIAAINGLESAHLALADGDDTAWNALEQIAAAWPLELLQQTK
jgi:hypothetical protein